MRTFDQMLCTFGQMRNMPNVIYTNIHKFSYYHMPVIKDFRS